MRARATDRYIIKVTEMSGSNSSVPGKRAFRERTERTITHTHLRREKLIMSMLCACGPGRIHANEFRTVI
jgi:hypothetical protein